ncbi:hypothetical protein AGMMS49521_3070 [Campylobacterota bacterium]|nr:hypothetical protein AGMMS49521_3070 [Campylobacterota bacterium]
MKNVWFAEQKLIALQALVFVFLATITITIGAVVYNKTSIHAVQNTKQTTTITGGFNDLKKNVDQ